MRLTPPILRHSKTPDSGFTLLEIIIVIALIAVLAAISVPSFISWSKNLNYRQASKQITSMLREARTQAISTNLQYMVVIEPQNNCYEIYKGTLSYNTPPASFTTLVQQVTAPSNVIIRGGSGGTLTTNVSVTFNPNGTAIINTATDGGFISVNDATSQRYSISVSATGKITPQKK